MIRQRSEPADLIALRPEAGLDEPAIVKHLWILLHDLQTAQTVLAVTLVSDEVVELIREDLAGREGEGK